MENKNILLKTIIGRSKTRLKLLGLFYTRDNTGFYTRQLQNMLNVRSVGTLHRELSQLENAGLIKSYRQANIRFFKADDANPLFDEIKSIISKTLGAEVKIRSALETIDGIEIAFIYGSYAKGEEKPTSDIDIFLIGTIDISILNAALSKLEKHFKREINYSAFTRAEFKKEIKKKGFIQRVINAPKIFIIGSENELKGLG